ncbi:type IV pilin protein [Noviherbaspirillum malthae]|uniref:type IV pilin protein n=1 Tax=Noviherbaspirillum malthae TaxID=1260987 RepID=UPI00188F6905|nr:type IV pilin protein [Noviherbaspirillum malthae]
MTTRHNTEQVGFTLIELVIAIAVVAILAAVALPSYQQYVVRANRAAAQAEMMEMANREQAHFVAHRTYADVAALGMALSDAVAAKYTPTITVVTDPIPGYTIVMTPKGSQQRDGALSLNSEGVKTPAAKW